MSRSPSRTVVVAGMHRAGTSVVARALIALGVDFGDRLMAANPAQNARGFFEDTDIVAHDDAVLRELGTDWKGVELLERIAWSSLPLTDAACALVARRFADKSLWGFKDPRATRLLPHWRAVFDRCGVEPSFVIATRDPRSVADSLTERDRLAPQRSLLLWLTHMAAALYHTAGAPRLVVDYDRLLADPERELRRIEHALALSPGGDVAGIARDYADAFLSAQLRHAQHAPETLVADPALPALIVELGALLDELARDTVHIDAPGTRQRVERVVGTLRSMEPVLDYLAAAARQIEALEPRLKQVEIERAWAIESLEASKRYAEDLKATLAARQGEIAQKDEYVADLKRALGVKEGQLLDASQNGDRLHARLAELEARPLVRASNALARVRGRRATSR